MYRRTIKLSFRLIVSDLLAVLLLAASLSPGLSGLATTLIAGRISTFQVKE